MKRYLISLLFLFPLCIFAQLNEMHPYLQTPSANSMYVCWLAASGNESTVQYGTTQALGLTQTGDIHVFNDEIKWHWAKLQNLSPNTRYYYKCITGSQNSEIFSFTTVPSVSTPDGHLRMIFIGDSRTNVTDLQAIVTAIQDKLLELYGDDWRQMFHLICHSGDTVEWAGAPDSFVDEFFIPFNPISSSIPIMVAPGNHEGENDNFYNFMKTEDIAGPEGKMYFSFDLADTRFIFMDSNIQGETQLDWIQSEIAEANLNNDTDFIFGVTHHYGHSEILPSENTAWVEDSVIPQFNVISKPTMLVYGHAHTYERGTTTWGRTRLLLSGGGGGPLESWGEDANQQDYPEIHVAFNYWNYSILDIDLTNHSYDARTFVLGNEHITIYNDEIDTWSQTTGTVAYQASAVSAKAPTDGLVKLVSNFSDAYSNSVLMSSQMMVSSTPSFTTNLVDKARNWVDFYGDSGSPNYLPININEGIDLKRLVVPAGILQEGQTYFWKARYQSQNTDWGNWSNIQSFTFTPQPIAADFAYTQVGQVNEPIQFTDTSIGNPTFWTWYFDQSGANISNAQDPVWSYNTPGLKQVLLIAQINGLPYTAMKTFTVSTPNDDPVSPLAPFHLLVYPNPSPGTTKISFVLKKSEKATAEVYNIRGERIQSIDSQFLLPGTHDFTWNAPGSIANGIYFIRLHTDSDSEIRKVLVLR